MSDRQHILVIGTGSIGERHVRCFLASGRVEVSICEVNESLRKQISERYDVTAAYKTLDEALGTPPNAAVVCTPANLHVAMARQAMAAGCHVLIEKPLSTNLNGIDELEALAREKDLVAGLAYVYRCHPLLTDMREALRDGRFGKPLQLNAACGQNFPHFRPAYRDIYFADHKTGGGAIQDALTHFLNAGEWLVGPITSVSFDAAHCALEGVEVEDTVQGTARHGDVLASYTLNLHQAPTEATITVICERGTARFDYYRNHWLWMSQPDGEWNQVPFDELERDELFRLQADAFLDAIDGQREVPCSLAEGIQTLRVNLAVLASVQDGSRKHLSR